MVNDKNALRNRIIEVLNGYKYSNSSIMVEEGIRLRVPKFSDEEIKLLTDWRNINYRVYPTQFVATEESTRNWLDALVFGREDRILFMIEVLGREIIGHIGLSNFNFDKKICELDNCLRGVSGKHPGLMAKAVRAIIEFSFDTLKMETVILRTFSDNIKAINFYEKCGFYTVKKIPLRKVVEGSVAKFVEIEDRLSSTTDNFFNLMQIKKI